MANFIRDTDHDAFDAVNDPTSAAYARARSFSQSPTKPKSRHGDASDAPDSLIKRMGGASATKAGLVADRSEIDRKIYEVSKGSSFFENERQKDAILTTKLAAFKQQADRKMQDLLPGTPRWARVEKEIDAMVHDFEAHRNLTRTIVHCDMDMFYAAVELRRDPSLQGKAFCVGGQDGVLVTASYEARRFGVSSGMAGFVAKALCPHLIFVKNAMADYIEASRDVMDVLAQYDANMAQASLDEAYLDITDYCAEHDMTAEAVVKQLREEVRAKTGGLSVSCGIAPNTMLAKICSDRNKPDGQYRIPPTAEACRAFMRDLRCRKCPGIGKVAERQLSELGIRVWEDVWTSRVRLHTVLHNGVRGLLRQYLGLGSTVVEPGKRENRKSVGRESTFRPTTDLAAMQERLLRCATQLQKDLERLEFRGRTLTLVVKTARFQRLSRAKTSPGLATKYLAQDLFKLTSDLLLELQKHWDAPRYGPFEMRLIGLRLTNLRDLRAGTAKEKGSLAWTLAQKEGGEGDGDGEGELGNGDGDGEGDAEGEGELPARTARLSEQQQFELAIRRSLQDQQQAEHGHGWQGDADELLADAHSRDPTPAPQRQSASPAREADERPSAPPRDHAAAACPICATPLPARKADESAQTHNARINAHLDKCLGGAHQHQPQLQTQPGRQRSADADAPPGLARRKTTSTSPPPSKRLKQSTLDAWRS